MKNPFKSLRRKPKVDKEEGKEEKREASVGARPPTPTFWEKLDSSARSEIIQWIINLPYEDKHHLAKEGRIKGTGEWLLRDERYGEWRTSAASQLLWLHGDLGAGKTKLVSTVIDDLQKPPSKHEALAYFYCDHNHSDPKVPDWVSILSSFVRQLLILQINDAIPFSVAKIYKERRRTGFVSGELCPKESQAILVDLFQIFPQTTLVVDALDGCDKETRADFMEKLNELVMKSSNPVKILVSSRRDTNSRCHFKNELNLEIREIDNRDDIAMFVKHEVIEKRGRWEVETSAELVEFICKTLVERSGGMFRWVALQICVLRELIVERDIRNRLEKLKNPEPLEAAYRDLYHKIQSEDECNSTIANRALQWTMCSCQPLSPAELVAAVCQDPDTDEVDEIDLRISSVIDCCQNLLVVDQEPKVCRLSHFSVGQYLKNNHWSSCEPDLLAAKVCLSLLISDSATSRQDTRLRKEESKYGSPNDFLKYARQNCATHIQRLQGITDARLEELLRRFDSVKKSLQNGA